MVPLLSIMMITISRVRVSFDTIEWDFGIDLDLEFVYAKCKTDTQQD